MALPHVTRSVPGVAYNVRGLGHSILWPYPLCGSVQSAKTEGNGPEPCTFYRFLSSTMMNPLKDLALLLEVADYYMVTRNFYWACYSFKHPASFLFALASWRPLLARCVLVSLGWWKTWVEFFFLFLKCDDGHQHQALMSENSDWRIATKHCGSDPFLLLMPSVFSIHPHLSGLLPTSWVLRRTKLLELYK